FFIIAVQTLSIGISILLAVGTPSTGSGKLYCKWELSSSSRNALCILFPTKERLKERVMVNAASTPVTALEPNSTNSTNTFSAAGPSNNDVSSNFELGRKSSYVDPSQYLDDPDMPALED
nr:hypothetical protein [Tanacetum cinerariifolium]